MDNQSQSEAFEHHPDKSFQSANMLMDNYKFRRVIQRFAEQTSMHGCTYTARARHAASRIIWAFLTLSAVVAVVIHLYMVIDEFSKWPKSTQVSLGYKNLRFPAITLCNVNPLRRSALKTHGTPQLKGLIHAVNPSNFMESLKTADMNGTIDRLTEVFDSVDWTSFADGAAPVDDVTEAEAGDDDDWTGEGDVSTTITEVFRFLYMKMPRRDRATGGHHLKDMLLACSFSGKKCFARNFTMMQTASYGNCFTLDKDLMVAKRPGPDGGLKLELYLETDEFVAGLANGYGLKIIVHDQGTLPLPDHDGAFIASASETNIALKQSSITRLGGRHGSCNDGSDFENKYGFKYSLQVCHETCLAEYIMAKCGCWHYSHENIANRMIANYTMCRSETDKKCQMRCLREAKRKLMTCHCDNKCTDTQYDMSISSRQWPSDKYALLLMTAVCHVQKRPCDPLSVLTIWRHRQSFVKLNIYYETLNFESIVEKPLIPPFTMLSNIGGGLGLWIGLSMLSVCEVLQLLIELTTCLINVCFRARQPNPTE